MEQQQQQIEQRNREEEYLAAQRAGVEALHIGRATLTQAEQQGEQLDRANALADETDYKLDRATRVLRGMTWSGWVANMFSKSVGPPPDGAAAAAGGGHHHHEPPDVYEGLPSTCHTAAQHVQNYHANVKVLEACETEEQKATCRFICDDMFKTAMQGLDDLRQKEPSVEAYVLQLARDLEMLRNRQLSTQQRVRGLKIGMAGNKKELMSSSADATTTTAAVVRETDIIQQQQEQHLNTISQALGELGSIAQSLNQSMANQNETLSQLDTKSENILEKQNMVNRRTERLIQNKSWTPVKPTFHASVSIRHVATGLYLAVLKNELFLTKKYHPETCVFGVWKRQGQIFGLKSDHSRKWVGQNLFGNLACTAGSFGRREEWEATNADNWSSTKLICASAGWGNGGYLLVRRKDYALLLGGSSAQDRENAAVWCIQQVDGDE